MVKIARKRRGVSPMILLRRLGMAGTVLGVMILLVTSIQQIGSLIDEEDRLAALPTATTRTTAAATLVSYQTPLAYGTKGLKDKTAQLVQQAIQKGFRHIVTAGHHMNHNETGVGLGWRASRVPREELFLQTSVFPMAHQEFQKDLPDEALPASSSSSSSIEEQVRYSVRASLKNLQTDYIDAVVFHNFRAKLWDTEQIHQAWKTLEEYVHAGVIRQLGLTSVHDANWFETFYNATTIKPTIVQNRFHSNRQYDVHMQETFQRYNIWVQRFWLLNGSSRFGRNNHAMAAQKGVTNEQLLLAFVMSLGKQTCLVGPTSLQHMEDDLDVAQCYHSLLDNDRERLEYAKKLGMKPNGGGGDDELKAFQQRYGMAELGTTDRKCRKQPQEPQDPPPTGGT